MAQVNFDFTGMNFIVTGASSGMGRQIATELAAAGANVLALGRSVERLQSLKQETGEKVTTAAFDICDSEKLEAAVEEFTSKVGKISGAVHSAGIYDFTPLKSYDMNTAKEIMDTSFWAGAEFVRILQKKKYSVDGASFVLFSSVSAFSGENGLFAYSAAKAATLNAVKTFAKEISKRKLRVNAICPGRIKTPMTEGYVSEEIISRHILGEGEPKDISGAVLFLLSDRARFITGAALVADGGYLAN